MRYTRYNYKPPKKKNNFMFVIILTLIAAVALGTVFSKLLPKNNVNTPEKVKTTSAEVQKDDKTNKGGVDASKVTSETNTKNYVALQCGVFSKKENALTMKNSLINLGIPFIMKEEDNTYKVMLGIYPTESIDSITKQLLAKKIIFRKINFKIIGNDNTSAQTNEMISADIKILNKLSEKDTKSYDTVKLKEWLVSLQGSDAKSANYSNMSEIKKYLNALPAVLNKEKTEEGYIYIYRFIKKIAKV